QDGFQSQQDCHFVISKKNAALHVGLRMKAQPILSAGCIEMRRAADQVVSCSGSSGDRCQADYNTLLMPEFFVQNFGCRATQADGAAIERQLAEKGLLRAPSPRTADVVVLNTCTVTASADQDARAAIRRVHRENPGAQILVTGCYAQRAPQEIAA